MIMSYILLFILGLILGAFLIPIIVYLRARRTGWDDSNIFNVLRVICHLALHPDDFLKMRYEDGKNPFPYLTKDEFSEVVDARPNKNDEYEKALERAKYALTTDMDKSGHWAVRHIFPELREWDGTEIAPPVDSDVCG